MVIGGGKTQNYAALLLFLAGLSACVPLVIYAAGEDETTRDDLAVEIAPREYVVLPDEDNDLAGLLSGGLAHRRSCRIQRSWSFTVLARCERWGLLT